MTLPQENHSIVAAPAARARRTLAVFPALLYALIALGCAWRFYEVILHNPLSHLWSDPQRHWDHASMPLIPSPMALFDPPVFQTWLSVIQRFTTKDIPLMVALYAGLLSVVGPWCWYRFLRESLRSRTLALAGWAALALLPSWVSIYSYFMTETLFLPAMGASLWLSKRAQRKKDLGSFLAMVGMWIFCGLTRPVAIPAAALFATVVWFGHPQKLRTAAWSVVILVVTLGPISWRNYHYYGLWEPHGNGWINKIYANSGARIIEMHFEKQGAKWLYGFGSPSNDTQPLAPFSDWTSSRSGTVHVNVDFMHGARDWKAAYEATALHGANVWRLRKENWILLFFGTSWPDNNPNYLSSHLANLSRWMWAPFALVLLIATFVWWREALSRPLVPLLIAMWLFFQAWLLVVPNEGRYRKPLEGLFIVYALVLLDARRSARLSAVTQSPPPPAEPPSPPEATPETQPAT